MDKVTYIWKIKLSQSGTFDNDSDGCAKFSPLLMLNSVTG